MANNEKESIEKATQEKAKTCFVIMPISDHPDYEKGHFNRVYEYIIKPACEKAGYKPVRADDHNKSNFIVADIVQKVVNADMAICDLSSRNPNVFYELGLRQAFNKKTVLVKDYKTPRAFDVSGLRDMEYNESLRIDEVNKAVENLYNAIKETAEMKESEMNSMIQILGISKSATLAKPEKLTPETQILLNEIRSLNTKMNSLQNRTKENVYNSVSSFYEPEARPFRNKKSINYYFDPEIIKKISKLDDDNSDSVYALAAP